MRIAVITSGFLPVPATKGGAVENLLINLLMENDKNKKNEFEILSIYDKEAVEKSSKYKHSDFIFIKINPFIRLLDRMIFFVANLLRKKNSFSYRYICQRLVFLRKCSSILKRNNYDRVLLENHPSQYLALKWHKNYKKYNGKYYYHCHNEFPSSYGCLKIIKNTKRIICVSEFRKNNVKKYLKMDENRFSVLKNGIDAEIFRNELTNKERIELRKRYKLRKNDRVLLYTGRIIPDKGVKEAILAINKLNKKNVKLLIVGAALNKLNARTKYEQEVEALVGNNVIFTGFVNYDDIYKYYKLADIAILPSIWDDSAPLTIIEALVSGLPIISTISGGIPEYATNGSAILIKRDGDLVDNIAKSIDVLLNDGDKLKKMSDVSKDISKNYTKEKFYNSFCEEILRD